jgi:IS5 family transposase
MKQTTFASLAFDRKKKPTRREKFLAEMERAVPWSELLAVIEPHYPKAGRRGRQPFPLATMLRLYFLQQWYALSDPGLEDALYEIESMRRFAGLELADDALPDETTILKFRRLLERHELTAKLMNAINDVLEKRGLLLKGGTMVDATIIHAAPSTKNQAQARDPEMHQTKKGNQWCVSRTQAADLWCCTEDGSRPPEAGLQEQASNHPVLLRSKGAVVSDRAKVIP